MKKVKRKFKQTNGWIEENRYYFGERGFDKRAYENLVLAVRETEANVPFAESRVDWHFASLCLCVVNGNSEQFDEVQTSAALKGNKTAQAFGYEWWKFNYAFENYTVYAIEQFRQTMLVKDTNWNVGFGTWIREQMNEDGDFVYFADSKQPIVVRSMYNGMSDELKAKCDANNGIVSLADYTDDMERRMEAAL